jgi:hypothetical protein
MDKDQGVLEHTITLPHYSQVEFDHFLKYCYGYKMEPSQALPMLCLSEFLKCPGLAEECDNVQQLGYSEQQAIMIWQHVLPMLTLHDTVDTCVRDNRLMTFLIWFTIHFGKMLELELDVVSLIPIKWLRFVFVDAPCHMFEDERDRLDKALQFYLKIGHSDELFSALFEGIKFKHISSKVLSEERYHFLYQTDNNVVLDNLMQPRMEDVFVNLSNGLDLCDCVPLVATLLVVDLMKPLQCDFPIKRNLKGRFFAYCGKDTLSSSLTLSLLTDVNVDKLHAEVTFLVVANEENDIQWRLVTCRKDRWTSEFFFKDCTMNRSNPKAEQVIFKICLVSLRFD